MSLTTLALTAAFALGSTIPAAALAPQFPVVIDRPCNDVNDNFVAKDRIAGCVDSTRVSPVFVLYGRTGLDWVDIGTSIKPGPSDCVPGHAIRSDGWTWNCVGKGGRNVLVKTKPWVRPAQWVFQHTASPRRSTVELQATTPMSGCRLSASDKRILGSQAAELKGVTARRVLDTSTLPPGRYTLRMKCAGPWRSSSSDLVVQPDRSVVLRSDCLDAWHDAKYGDVVPGYGRRLDPLVATSIAGGCARLAPLTDDELQRAGREAYLKIAQIAEREVRRVSAAEGLPICEAIAKVFKPVDTVGRAVAPHPIAGMDITVPIAGYLPDGYFPVLHRQWSDGPVRMDNVANCDSPNQSLRLAAGTWSWCRNLPLSESSADPHQMFPVYVFDRPACPLSYPTREINQNSVCITWSDQLGNNAVGGTGKVFAADAINASSGGDLAYDCADRAARVGQFANVDVKFAPALK